jgi:hypothetical protein
MADTSSSLARGIFSANTPQNGRGKRGWSPRQRSTKPPSACMAAAIRFHNCSRVGDLPNAEIRQWSSCIIDRRIKAPRAACRSGSLNWASSRSVATISDDMALTQGFEEQLVGRPGTVGQALSGASQHLSAHRNSANLLRSTPAE